MPTGDLHLPVSDGQGNTTAAVVTIIVDDPGVDQTVSGDQANGFTVPAGETWEIQGEATSPANVVVEGTLRMRAGATLRFRDVDESAYVGGDAPTPPASDVGLWVQPGGVLDAIGTPKVAWTRAVGPVALGATEVTVQDATGWLPGDEIVLTPTAHRSVSGWWDRYSVSRILSLSGNTVQLETPTQQAHPAPVDQLGRAWPCEVLNLTRDVRIEGTPSGRAHVIFNHATEPVHVRDVELRHLGPDRLGRYPLHLHMMGDASEGSVIESVVAHHVGNHAFVPHTSNGVTLRHCVAHDVIDDAFFWDADTPTSRNVWEFCVASRINADPGFRLAGFNLNVYDGSPGGENTCRHCVACGVGGDGPPSPDNSTDPGGFVWPELGEVGNPVWIFHDNVAHNCVSNGLFTWQNEANEHFVDDSVIYNCSYAINHGAYRNRYVYRRIVAFDCHQVLRLHAASVGGDLAFEDIDAVVYGPQAWDLASVTAAAASSPVHFRRCKVRGYTLRGVRAFGDGGGPEDDEWPGLFDFHDCDWEPGLPHVVITSGAPSGTVVREFEDGVLVAEHTN